jgi:hypothetical protein
MHINSSKTHANINKKEGEMEKFSVMLNYLNLTMIKYLLAIFILVSSKCISQTQTNIDTNRIYVRIVSDFAKSNPSLVLYPTVKMYASDGIKIGVADIPLNNSAWFFINCSGNKPIVLIADYAFKNKKPIPAIPGTFNRGDSIVVNIDNVTTKIIK